MKSLKAWSCLVLVTYSLRTSKREVEVIIDKSFPYKVTILLSRIRCESIERPPFTGSLLLPLFRAIFRYLEKFAREMVDH